MKKISTYGSRYPRYVVFVVNRDELHCLRQPDLNFDDIVNVAFLYRRAVSAITLLCLSSLRETRYPSHGRYNLSRTDTGTQRG
jgi:hypothetical protein